MMDIETAIGVIESISGVTDESTPAGEAWEVILSAIYARPASTAQVIQEREELARLLRELSQEVAHGYFERQRLAGSQPPWVVPALADRARGAAERLKGGGDD